MKISFVAAQASIAAQMSLWLGIPPRSWGVKQVALPLLPCASDPETGGEEFAMKLTCRVIAIATAAGLVAGSAALRAQNALPAGTILPASLDHALNSQRVHPGQEIRAEIMQDIPGTTVRRHNRLVGHVIGVSGGANGAARLEIRFDAVEAHGRRIPVSVNLRALASFLEVEEAQVPEEGASRGITAEVATTRQIGGDQVYRGGGPVAEGITTVGRPVAYGVLGLPRTNPEGGCRGALGADSEQAWWLFSTNACGVYGYSNIRIEHAGRAEPVGDIVLSALSGKLELQSGTGMLFRVD